MDQNASMDSQWLPITVREVYARFSASSVPWWIAGGVAIDLLLGWETRPHADIDVEMFRSDRDALVDILHGWDLSLVSAGELTPFDPGQRVAENVYGVWGRPNPEASWAVVVMLADGDRSEWRFRRDNAITLSGDRLFNHTPSGIPYCTPEVQLLYKAKKARPKDDIDFARCLHRLTSSKWE